MTDQSQTLAFQVESRLMAHGIYVQQCTEEDGRYSLRYESMAAETGVIPHRELGRVINVFRDLHDDDWSGVTIDATVLDLDGNEQVEWYVDADWLDSLHNGELTEIEFSERVVSTLEEHDSA